LKMSENHIEPEDFSKNICECINETKTKSAKKQKRPDKQLYIPPGSKNGKAHELVDCQARSDKSPNSEKNEPSWDSLYDDNGDVIDNEFVSDLNYELDVKVISNQLASSKLDYSKFSDQNNLMNPDDISSECGHILEVYDFSSELKTRDLITSLSATKYV